MWQPLWLQYMTTNHCNTMNKNVQTLEGNLVFWRKGRMTQWKKPTIPNLMSFICLGLQIPSSSTIVALDYAGLTGWELFSSNILKNWVNPGNSSTSRCLINLLPI